MNNHLLQSKTWQKYEELEGHKTYFLEDKDFHALAVEHRTPFGNYLYCPYGPEVSNQKSLQKALKALQQLGKEQGAMFIRIEPRLPLAASEMAKYGNLKKSHDLDPAHTWHLDLSASEDELLGAMESRKVRYWRNHQKKGISLRQSQDPEEIGILTQFLQGLGEVDNFTPQDKNHLKNQLKSGFATLYIAELEEPDASGGEKKHPIAAALIYDYGDTRYYAHAATDYEHRKLAAGTIILIQMILDAKKQGQKIYDFWGITTSEDPNHPWYGFTQYKKSFGGYQVDYAGTYDLILNPYRYKIYQLFRKLNRLKRRIKK